MYVCIYIYIYNGKGAAIGDVGGLRVGGPRMGLRMVAASLYIYIYIYMFIFIYRERDAYIYIYIYT